MNGTKSSSWDFTKDEYQQTLEYVLGYADELDIAV